MSFLDQLTPDQRESMISLPYRVGLYVSQSDKSGGDESNEKEAQALSNILQGYAQEVFGAETVQYVISETVSRQRDWDDWSDDVDKVEGDCHRAIDILSELVDEKEVSAFKQHLIEIGESVALAFREYDESLPFLTKLRIYYHYYRGKSQAAKRKENYKSFDEFLNISLDERKALNIIAGALNTTYV
jgi:hypothetical protein